VQLQVLQRARRQHLAQLRHAQATDAVVAQVGHNAGGVEGERLDHVRCALVAQVFGGQVGVLAVLQQAGHLVQASSRLALQLLGLHALRHGRQPCACVHACVCGVHVNGQTHSSSVGRST
jgi:hypothetical protein